MSIVKTSQTKEQILAHAALVQKRVYSILAPIFNNDTTLAAEYVNNTALSKYWLRVFTHVTFNAAQNYERLETIGDSIAKGVFISYLTNSFEDLDPASLTELHNYYMSGIYQEGLAISLGFATEGPGNNPQGPRNRGKITSDIIQTQNIDIDQDRTILGDIFEAFIGALYNLGNERGGFGTGYVMAYNLIVNLFSKINIDLDRAKGGYKARVSVAIFSRLGLTIREREQYDHNLATSFFTISIPKETLTALNQTYGKTLDSNRYKFSSEAPTKTEASELAYKELYEYLESRGVTVDWARDIRQKLDFAQEGVSEYASKAQDKAAKQGFTDITFEVPTGGRLKGKSIVQLIGSRKLTGNRIERIILANVQAKNERDARSEAIKYYVNNTGG